MAPVLGLPGAGTYRYWLLDSGDREVVSVRSGSRFVRVVASDQLAPREGLESQIRCVPVGDQMVLVGRLEGGTVVAFAATCPHEMTDLQHATFVGGQVRCPKHNYLYDPHSGANIIPTEVSRKENLWKLRPGYLATYRAEERDGWVWVSEQPNPAPDSWDPASEQRPANMADRAASVVAPPEPEPTLAEGPVIFPAERLQVALGGELVVHLPTAPRPAYLWRIEVPAGVLAVVGQSFEPEDSPPRHHVHLRALRVGEATVCCSYRRPWDADPAEVRTYVVEVENR